jgi:hypothetical protein
MGSEVAFQQRRSLMRSIKVTVTTDNAIDLAA